MGVERVSSPARQSQHTRAIGRAVDLAMKDIKKVQSRMTEELRAEDAIRGLELHGSEVHVLVDTRYEFKKDGLRDLVKELLKKHGASGVRVEIHEQVDLKDAVASANASLETIHNRRTRDIRVEDGVSNLAVRDDGKIAVVLKPRQPYDEARIEKAIKRLLTDAGVKAPKLEFVRAAIEPVPPGAMVASASAAIHQVQQRMTADMRAEDDIVNLSWGGSSVKVVLKARPYFSEAEIGAVVQAHLEKAGLRGADLEYVRPAINPFRPPVIAPPVARPTGQPTSMKQKVEQLAADVQKVQSRLTEELRTEDAIASIKTIGAKVEVKYFTNTAFTLDNVKAFITEELKERGVTLPVTFVKKDPRDV
jgi:hypothetical protein